MSIAFIDYIRQLNGETKKKKDPRKVDSGGVVFIGDVYRELLRLAIREKIVTFSGKKPVLKESEVGPLRMEITPHTQILKIVDSYYPNQVIMFFVNEEQ